ncbi:MAG TPA: VOC family protein, partial [Reyranella sp.]
MTIPFAVRKIGHAVIFVSDIERSKRFYTEVLGFQVSDVYDGSMMPGGMVFLRCNGDHHCLALVGDKGDAANGKSLHHIAFELATIDEVIRARD